MTTATLQPSAATSLAMVSVAARLSTNKIGLLGVQATSFSKEIFLSYGIWIFKASYLGWRDDSMGKNICYINVRT